MGKTMQRSIMSRSLAVGALGLAGLLAAAAPAAAHVSVQPGQAEQGGYAAVEFRVPNERDDAGTTKVEINLPEDKPLTSVRTRALPGWTSAVEKKQLPQPITSHGKQITEFVAKVTWTANPGTKINPGSYEDFSVSMGTLPTDTDQLVFKALQTYESGEVVRWIDVPAPGAAEPEHPAPVLKLVPKGGASPSAVPAPAPSAGVPAATAGQIGLSGATVNTKVSAGKDNTARTIGVVGLIVGALGLAVGAYGITRARHASA
jgi:uncharacterized protein YcnI